MEMRNSLRNVVLILFLSSCGPSGEVSEPKPPTTPKIANVLSLALVPVADGGIYAVDEMDGVVWYVSNGKAVRLSAFKADFINEIVPAAEGGAYIHITTEDQSSSLWYLKGETATKIEENPSVGQFKGKPRSAESWLWAMWQTERLRKQRAEDRTSE